MTQPPAEPPPDPFSPGYVNPPAEPAPPGYPAPPPPPPPTPPGAPAPPVPPASPYEQPPAYGQPPPPPGYAAPGYAAPGYGQQPAYGQPPAYPGGYGYAGAPPPGYAPAAPAGTDGFAIASLIGAFFCSPLGLIFGIVSLRRIKSSGRGGRGLAIAGIVISLLFIVIAVAGIAVFAAGRASRDSNGAITSSGKVAVTDLRVGDCINFPASLTTEVRSFDAVPCGQPHDGEAYASGDLALSGDWPGTTAVTTATETQCRAAFEPFVGLSLDSSSLAVTYFYPLQDTWSAGDRGYVCLVGVDGSKTTGTLKGANR